MHTGPSSVIGRMGGGGRGRMQEWLVKKTNMCGSNVNFLILDSRVQADGRFGPRV